MVAAMALAGCGNSAGAEGTPSTSATVAGNEVVLVTHDSFVVHDAVLGAFEKSSG